MIFGPDNAVKQNDYMIEILRGGNSFNFWGNNIDKVDHFTDNGHTYYSLAHGSEYKVKMTNNTFQKVNALLKIDGVLMGKWRIDPFTSVIIERPVDNQRKFTFVDENSWEARDGNVVRGINENGLVEVTFFPELKSSFYSDTFKRSDTLEYRFNRYHNLHKEEYDNTLVDRNPYKKEDSSDNFISFTNSYSAGATVLGDDSWQSFGQASKIHEDHARKVTKRLRLVISNRRKPFISIRSGSEIRDDPVPPRFGNNHHTW
jgi:hypothetical protein